MQSNFRRSALVWSSVLVVALFAGASRLSDRTRHPEHDGKNRLLENYGKLPLAFETNQGQTDPRVKFLSRGPGYALFLTPTDAVMQFSGASPVRMELKNANPAPEIEGIDELQTKANYFVGADPSSWTTNIAEYKKVRYKDVYPGIDLIYYGKQRQLEYDLVIAPGADPRSIALDFEGQQAPLEVNEAGDLVLHTEGGDLFEHAPRIYQQIAGAKREIQGSYLLKGANEVGFEVRGYDTKTALVIDPGITYSFTFGGTGNDIIKAMAVDSSGNAYVTGNTYSSDFPVVSGFQSKFKGGDPQKDKFLATDSFVAKVNAAGTALVYSTYLGGSDWDQLLALAIDSSGNAYVAGYTYSKDFPMQNPIQAANKSSISNGFVTKLNPSGSALVYSTYIGGSGSAADTATGIAVDSSGNAYVAGGTTATDFPTKNPLQASLKGSLTQDAFIAKINPGGTAFVYSTYLGGSVNDAASGVAVDSAGNAYVAGATTSTDFPTAKPFQASRGSGQSSFFVTKVSADGASLVYSSYLGGKQTPFDNAIIGPVVDPSGNAYVAGYTNAPDFPAVNAYQSKLKGSYNGFVSKINAAGSALAYSTYLGGSGSDFISGLAVDVNGRLFVAGQTNSSDFPQVLALQTAYGGGSTDMFSSILSANGSSLDFSSYFGGSGDEAGGPIALDGTGYVYLAGATNSTNFPAAFALSNASDALKGDEAAVGKYLDPKATPPAPAADIVIDVDWEEVENAATFNRFIDVRVNVENNGPDTANDVFLKFVPTNWPNVRVLYSVALDAGNVPRVPGTCSTDNRCAVPSLAKGGTLSVWLSGDEPSISGSIQFQAGAISPGDPDPRNNSIQINFYSGVIEIREGGSKKLISRSESAFASATGSVNAPSAGQNLTTDTAAGALPVALAVFGLTQNNILVTEAGVPAASPVTNARMFVDLGGGSNSGIALVNPGTSSIVIGLNLRDVSGTSVSTSSVTVPAKGHVAKFPDQLGLSTTANFLGTLTLSSSGPFAAANLRLASNSHGEPIFSALPVADLNNPPQQSSSILSQIVDGGGIPTQILLMNPSTSSAAGTIALFDDAGAALTADFGSTVGKQSQISYSIPANGMAKYATTGLGQLRAGYAVVTKQTGSLPVASAIFAASTGSGIASEAGVLSSLPAASSRMYTSVSSASPSRNTGIAMVNRNSSTASINLKLTDNLTGSVRTSNFTLAPNAHAGRFITELFTDLPADDFQGTLTLTSNVAIASVALRLTTNERGELLLSTLPVADLSNPPTGTQYLAQIVSGGGYTTELILINTSDSAVTAQLDFYDDNGVKITSPFP